MSFSSNWPIKNPPFFVYQRFDSQAKTDVYRLDPSKLSHDECHIFYPIKPCEESLITSALEYITFHPTDQKMNDKFNLDPITCDSINLFWCRFPKAFKDVCERTGKLFGMTLKKMPRVMVGFDMDIGKQTALEFPEEERILCFQGDRSDNPDAITTRQSEIESIGNSLEKLGLD